MLLRIAAALALTACTAVVEPEPTPVPVAEAAAPAPDAAPDADEPCEIPGGGSCFDGGTRGKAYRAACSGSWIAERCQRVGDVFCCAWW